MSGYEQDLITEIVQLWRLSASLTEIAKQLNLPVVSVKHVIQFHTFPTVQTFVLEQQPAPDKISER